MNKKLKDAIYGLAIGDAFGVPYEFKKRNTFKAVDMIGYGTHNQPIGTWSDDTSMTLATCYSILLKNKIDYADIRFQFEQWLFNNKFTPFNEVFDCGNTCSDAIYNKIGRTDNWSNGNGSLMRILPLAFIDNITNEQIEYVSAITHAHSISKEGCVIYVNIARDLIKNIDIIFSLQKNVNKQSIYSRLLDINTLKEDDIKSSGYVVDTLEAAIWCIVNSTSYKESIIKSVNLGDDTDTVAAVTGGLAGIIYGYNNIPKEWIDILQGKEIINKCLF